MARRTKATIALIILFVVFGGLFGWHLFTNYMVGKYMASYQAPPTTVAVVSAETDDWQPYLESAGTLVAKQGVNVSPQVGGMVTAINFDSGEMVKAGDLLVKLDDSVLKQQLAGSIAKVKLDQITYERDLKLLSQNALQQSTADTDLATLQQDQATVAQYEAEIAQTQIRAPFSGRLGIRDVNLGQYLSAGTMITNLQQLDPIFVDYPLPQQALSQIKVGQAVEVTISAYPDQVFKGKIAAINAQIGQDTLSITVRAEIANQDSAHLLLPGMLVTVHTLLPQQNNVITIPQVALDETLYGDSVFVVKSVKGKDGKPELMATRTYVTVGEQRADQVAITQGLNVGDQVVTFGQVKIPTDQAPVTINNNVNVGS